MPRFTVKRICDAYVYYEAEVEAATAEEASRKARENEEQHNWQEAGDTVFEARSFVTLDDRGPEIESTQVGRSLIWVPV